MDNELIKAYLTTINDLEIELNSYSPFQIFKIARMNLQIEEYENKINKISGELHE